MRVFRIIAIAVALAALAAIVVVEFRPFSPDASRGRVPIGGPFTLIDQTGATRRAAEFKGKLRLVFFGYTNCPDICPASLQTVSWALEKLGADAKQVVALFITVDPERDTQARLAVYHRSFDPRLIMLTGNDAAIARVKKAFRVVGVANRDARGPDGKPVENYPVNHTTLIYLLDRDGNYLSHFPHNAKPEEIVAEIRKHL